MDRTKKIIRTGLLSAGLCCLLLLTACTSQKTPIGERAMVRLIYLDITEDGRYRALAAVCDFSPDGTENEQSGDTVFLSAEGSTVEEALNAAAGSRGGKPFFAQNRLLLLSETLAKRESATILQHFADACSVYRDPSVWLWTQGEEALTQMPDPMAFVRMAENLARKDELGCVRRVLENRAEHLPSVLPILGTDGENDADPVAASVRGLALLEEDTAEFSYRENDLLAYGMLCGRSENIPFTVTTKNGKRFWQLRALRRSITAEDGILTVTLSGSGTQVGAHAEQTAEQRQILERQLEAFCTDGLHRLTKDGTRDCLDLFWWCEQLGLPKACLAEAKIRVNIRIK